MSRAITPVLTTVLTVRCGLGHSAAKAPTLCLDLGVAARKCEIEAPVASSPTAQPRPARPSSWPCGGRIIREAQRRGFDGAPWIWNFADERLPDATQVADIFHAKDHPFEVAKAIYGSAIEFGEQWARKRREELDEGRVADVVDALRSHAGTCKEARKDPECFSNHRERMNYPKFRAMDLCVATGIVEGGCKHIVGARLKQAGMRWTDADADAVIALRCAVESNRFDDFWERRASAGQ